MKKKFWLVFLAGFSFLVTSGTAEVSDILSINHLAVPPSLGKIESRYVGEGERWVIHIQDVHAHLTAQENIAALVEHLHTYYGIKIVTIEGGWSASSFPRSWALPPSRGKQMLARALLEDAYITGPIHAALFSSTPITIAGIEDKNLYEENRQVYLQHIEQREAVHEKIKALDSKIQEAKNAVFNPALLAFDQALMAFRDGKKAEKFIPSLIAQTESHGIDTEDLGQLSIFKKIMALEKELDKQKLQSEAGRLMEEFKRQGLHFEELLKSGTIPAEKLEFYPQSQKYLEIMHTQDEMNHRQFFSEIETAVQRIKEKLLNTEEEKALDKRSEAVLFAKKVTLFQATPDDLKAFEKTQQDSAPDFEEAGLMEALQLGVRFYELAKKRDDIFFERIARHPKLQGNIAVVTGGFHTEGMSAKLESEKISYVVISPDLADQPADEPLYFKRLQNNIPGTQALIFRTEEAIRMDRGFAATVALNSAGFSDRGPVETAVFNFTPALKASAAETEAAQEKPAAPFLSLSDEDQQNIVKEFLQMQTGTSKIVLIMKMSVLTKLLESPVALKLWEEEILSRKENHVFLIQDIEEIPDSIVGAKAPVRRIREDDILGIIQKERAKREGKNTLIGVVDPDFTEEGANLILKPHPAALLLLRPFLERNDSRISPEDLAALDRIQTILENSFAILRSA